MIQPIHQPPHPSRQARKALKEFSRVLPEASKWVIREQILFVRVNQIGAVDRLARFGVGLVSDPVSMPQAGGMA
jgi:hypothetical protein